VTIRTKALATKALAAAAADAKKSVSGALAV
jgi:hypothetical protein